MSNGQRSRRKFVKSIITATGVVSLPLLLHAEVKKVGDKKKIVVVGGHPDDSECGCGGTVPKLIQVGHEVSLMYFTNGDEGIEGKTHEEAAAIRRNECIEACKVLGTKPVFVNQIDGESVLGNPQMAEFEKILNSEKPDVVFAHWPIDSHKDHQLSSVLTIQAWMEATRPFSLYFYEVCTGNQTFVFHPTDYVDITNTHSLKLKALACHKSQDIITTDGKYTADMYNCGHPSMEDFRGKELGVPLAEAFIHMTGRGFGKLLL
ncbi:PIG-L family deacetylase [soil metagenome]